MKDFNNRYALNALSFNFTLSYFGLCFSQALDEP